MAPPKRSLAVADDGRASPVQVESEALAVVDAETRLAKRPRVQDIIPANPQVVTAKGVHERTSGLAAPTLLLTGHSAAVYGLEFDPSGQHIASASFDKSIFLWDVYGECKNYGVLSGHKNAVLDVHWSYDSTQLVSASADKTVGVWDAQSGTRVKKFAGHTGVVNSCCPVTKGPMMVASGSDDGTIKLWDLRSKRPSHTFENGYQVMSVCFAADNTQVFSGGLDGDIKLWDLRKDEVSLVLRGHSDIVTSLSLSPDGNYVLSNAMDGTVRRWDVRPFVSGERLKSVYHGAKHGFERNLIRSSWSADMQQVASGSSDRYVYIWDTETTALRYHLPGHTGSVNAVAFHPKEPIVASCSSDKSLFLGELAAAVL